MKPLFLLTSTIDLSRNRFYSECVGSISVARSHSLFAKERSRVIRTHESQRKPSRQDTPPRFATLHVCHLVHLVDELPSRIGIAHPAVPCRTFSDQSQTAIQGFMSFPMAAVIVATLLSGVLAIKLGKRRNGGRWNPLHDRRRYRLALIPLNTRSSSPSVLWQALAPTIQPMSSRCCRQKAA